MRVSGFPGADAVPRGIKQTFVVANANFLTRFRAQRAVQQLERVFRGLFDKVGIGEPTTVESLEFAAAAGREVDALFGD